MSRGVGGVELHVRTPLGARVRFFKQVSPEVIDLSDLVERRQPVGPDKQWRVVAAADPSRPLTSVYPTGAWSAGEEREYHLCLTVLPQEVGPEHEVRAARVSVVVDATAVALTSVRAVWEADIRLTSRIDRAVAHYTGQEELARSIEEGLAARRAGDDETATRRLGRAAQLAYASGNRETTRLLLGVVEIDDAERGTVRFRPDVSREDEMTLDTRSRRTVRSYRTSP